MLPYPQDCSKYYSCLNGLAYLQQCPSNLHWSTLTYRCEYPDKAKCQTAAASVTPITPVQPITPVSPDLTPSVIGEMSYMSHKSDCTKYYRCQSMSCPALYHWNSLTLRCDFPHNAHCPFAPGGIGAQLQIPTTSLAGEIFTIFYPNDCTKYYLCQTVACTNNLHWNLRRQKCDLPELAQCPYQPQLPVIADTTTTTYDIVPTAFTAPPTPLAVTGTVPSNVITEDPSSICPDCAQRCVGNLHHYLPHPFDCHKFIQCNGWSFIQTCPDNLFWNAKLNTCDRVCVPL